MSKSSDRTIVAVAVAIIAVILLGEVVVYTSDYTDFSADATYSDGILEYTISADGSKVYSVIVNDNGSYKGIDNLIIYYDPSYKANYEDVKVAIGAKELDQEYYVEQLTPSLRYRNVHDISIVDADGLREAMESDIRDETLRYGIVVISGALPETVYTGNGSDLVFSWMNSGGSLYWLGNLIGSCYATQDKLVYVQDYQELFFGSECLNTDGPKKAYGEIDGYCKAMSMVNTDLKYAVNGSLLPTDTKHVDIGFTDSGFSTASLIGYGSGMMCIISGDYSNNQRNDLAQIIASGIGPESEIVAIEEGTVTRGSISGTIGCSGENLSAFIYLGGYYPVYCKLFRL